MYNNHVAAIALVEMTMSYNRVIHILPVALFPRLVEKICLLRCHMASVFSNKICRGSYNQLFFNCLQQTSPIFLNTEL